MLVGRGESVAYRIGRSTSTRCCVMGLAQCDHRMNDVAIGRSCRRHCPIIAHAMRPPPARVHLVIAEADSLASKIVDVDVSVTTPRCHNIAVVHGVASAIGVEENGCLDS